MNNKMLEKTESCRICVKRLEEGTDDYLVVVFESPYGEHSILAKKEHIKVFCPGTKYEGIFKISGMPDFVGEKNEWENVCTTTCRLEKILGKNIHFETGEKSIIYETVIGNNVSLENE
jgi:hypothetical protein